MRAHGSDTGRVFTYNWLQVLDTAERPQIDQGICHQLHPIVSLLDTCKAAQEPLKPTFKDSD